MFWRILFQLVRVGRVRLLLALVAVMSGAAVSSALLNIHFDAERKLTLEFATLGPNVVIAARQQAGDAARPLLEEATLERLRGQTGKETALLPSLYFVGHVQDAAVIVAGQPMKNTTGPSSADRCRVGSKAAQKLRLAPGGSFSIAYSGKQLICAAAIAPESGEQEDSQIAVPLHEAQDVTGNGGKLSLVRLRVVGSAEAVAQTVSRLSAALPNLDVRPIRQIAEAEGQILGRIRGLIFATVALILALTALCVLSAMTALAMEHRRDVGLMKALGGDMSRVLRLFICEIAGLGVAGGLLGWACGVALSSWVGVQVFSTPIAPRPEVLPLIVALMTAVAMAGAFPLRLLSRVRPGVILRGE